MSKLDIIIKDLVIANRILAKEDVVDAYGHAAAIGRARRQEAGPKTKAPPEGGAKALIDAN